MIKNERKKKYVALRKVELEINRINTILKIHKVICSDMKFHLKYYFLYVKLYNLF